MIYSDELLAVAKCIFWFGTPEEALEFPKRFLTYAMTYASDEDIEILRKYFSDDDFKAKLAINFGQVRGGRSHSMNSRGTKPNVVSSPSCAPVTCRVYVAGW